jgi:hypothetical protein
MKNIFLLLVFCFSLFADEKFQSDISKKEKRIREYKAEAKELNIQFPEELKLFFKTYQGDYIVFYDWSGDEVLYRFRRNKFDHVKLTGLFQGQSYRIKGIFQGIASYKNLRTGSILHTPNFYLKEDPDRFWSYDITEKYSVVKLEDLQDKNTLLVYKLISFESTSIDELIY